MRARAGRAEEASLEILLPIGQPSNPVGQGAGRHTQDPALAVTVSRAPICEGTGGARKPYDPLELVRTPSRVPRFPHGVTCTPSSAGLYWASSGQGVVPARSPPLLGARGVQSRDGPRSRPHAR